MEKILNNLIVCLQGTPMGQKLHTAHMLILPLIPVFILLAQNTTNFVQYVTDASEIKSVQVQVRVISIHLLKQWKLRYKCMFFIILNINLRGCFCHSKVNIY